MTYVISFKSQELLTTSKIFFWIKTFCLVTMNQPSNQFVKDYLGLSQDTLQQIPWQSRQMNISVSYAFNKNLRIKRKFPTILHSFHRQDGSVHSQLHEDLPVRVSSTVNVLLPVQLRTQVTVTVAARWRLASTMGRVFAQCRTVLPTIGARTRCHYSDMIADDGYWWVQKWLVFVEWFGCNRWWFC